MKLILLYLAVVLCFVGKARSFRNGAGFYTSLGGQMRVFDFNKKTLDAKSSGGSKDYNLSDGGKSNSRKNLSPATGGSATQQSNLDDSHAPNLGKSETMLSLLGYLGAFRPVLSGLTSLPRVGGGAHGNIGLRAEISRNGVNLSGDSSARGSLNVNPLSGLSTKSGNDATVQGQQAAASGGSKHNVENSSLSTGSATSNKGADKPSEHLSNLFLKGLKGIVEPITSAAGGSVSSAVENLKAQIKKFIEPLTEDHGPTSTSASVSGDSSTSSRLDDHPSDGLSKVSGDDPTVQGHDVAASDGSKQNVEDSTLSTGSATSNEGDDKSSDNSSNTFREDLEKILEQITSAPGGSVSSAVENLKAQIKKFIEPLTEDHGPTSTSASVSGDSSTSSRLDGHSSDGLSKVSGDDPTVQGHDVAASDGSKQNVEDSTLSTGSATSNEGDDKSSDNSSNTFREDLEKILEQITSAPGGSVSTVNNPDEDRLISIIENLAGHIQQSVTEASQSAERPNAQSSNNLSGKLEPKYENPTNGSSSASSADKPYEEGMRKLLKFLEEQYGQTGTDASVSGMSSESSRSNVHLSDGFSMESGDDATVQGQQAAASGGPKQNVESSNSSTGSATSNGGGDSNEVSGPSSSAVDSTDSGDRGNLADKQGPGFNGPEGVGENNGGSFRAGSLDTGSKSDSGSHNLSSGSGSRSNVSTGGEPSDKNEPADPGVSGRVTCPTGKTQSGSPSVA
uniref:Submandibular gland protein C n=1 Tax=Mus musculus TaxID=10090 RepID=B9EHK5_MOUSE|nr:Submandibular gland protein C [Mus musculus]